MPTFTWISFLRGLGLPTETLSVFGGIAPELMNFPDATERFRFPPEALIPAFGLFALSALSTAVYLLHVIVLLVISKLVWGMDLFPSCGSVLGFLLIAIKAPDYRSRPWRSPGPSPDIAPWSGWTSAPAGI